MQGTDYVFPLWLYEETLGKIEKRANLNKEIVAKIGYIDVSSFSRKFSKVYGMTPTVYRKQYRQE